MHIDRNLLIGGVCMTAAVGLTTGLFIWPNYKESAKANRDAVELQSKIILLEGQAHAIDALNAEVAQTQEHIQTQLKLIPDAPDVASVIRKLSQEVDRVTVLDQTFTAGTPCDAIAGQSKQSNGGSTSKTVSSKSRSVTKGENPMQAMPLNVDMEASFDSLFALIQSAESLNRLVRITSVRAAISTTQHEEIPGAPPLLKAAVGLEAIYQPSPGSAKSDQKPITKENGMGATAPDPASPVASHVEGS